MPPEVKTIKKIDFEPYERFIGCCVILIKERKKIFYANVLKNRLSIEALLDDRKYVDNVIGIGFLESKMATEAWDSLDFVAERLHFYMESRRGFHFAMFMVTEDLLSLIFPASVEAD